MLAEVFVPGRLCVLGEHTDWAAGFRADNPAIAYGELTSTLRSIESVL